MFQTLTEALEANSLEHKLEMQIKASLEEGEMNEGLITELKIDKNALDKIDFSSGHLYYNLFKRTLNTKDIYCILTYSLKDKGSAEIIRGRA